MAGSHTRLFLVFTVAEAAALLSPYPSPSRDAARAKIRSAVAGATPRPPRTAAVPDPITPPPPLRAKDYPRLRLRPAKVVLRVPRPPIGRPAPPASDPHDDYVPWRDEAGGIHADPPASRERGRP